MAFYIQILKIEESGNKAMYRFHGDAGTAGVFEIDKSTGESKLVEPMAGDDRGAVYNRAAITVVREWREGRLPDFLEWAS